MLRRGPAPRGNLAQADFDDRLDVLRNEGRGQHRGDDLAARTYRVATKIQEESRNEPGAERAGEGSTRSLVGSWTLISRWGGVETQHSLVVHPDLTGRLTYARWGGAHDLPKVTVEGDAVSFDHRVSKGGWEMGVRFEGFVRGDTITGDFFTGVGATNVTGARDLSD